MNNRVLIILSTPPSQDMEALELALALAAFEHPVTLLLTGAGVGWLYQQQQPRKPNGRSADKLMAVLPMYDIDQVYYADGDLQQLMPTRSSIHTFAKPLNTAGVQQLIQQSQHCLKF
ncbi:MAG: DsrE family protein [Oceanobacter sp.]